MHWANTPKKFILAIKCEERARGILKASQDLLRQECLRIMGDKKYGRFLKEKAEGILYRLDL